MTIVDQLSLFNKSAGASGASLQTAVVVHFNRDEINVNTLHDLAVFIVDYSQSRSLSSQDNVQDTNCFKDIPDCRYKLMEQRANSNPVVSHPDQLL